MDNIIFLSFLATLIGAAWRLATPLIFASIGEVISERAGVLNIGIEGTMAMGAFCGFAATFATGSLPLGLAAGVAAGLLFGLIFAFFAITIKADQIVVGAAINLLGLGLTAFLFRAYYVSTGRGVEIARPIDIPWLSDLPYLGEALFRQNLIVYSTIPAVILAAILLNRTSFGLTLRATGDHPKAVDVAGRSVALYRYGAVLIGSALAGLGGAFLTLGHSNQFVEGITSGRGFIALAVVVFARWSPVGAFFVSLLFGVFYALQLQLQAQPMLNIPYQALQVLPYVMTILALVLVRGKNVAPRKLGIPYGER
ncbi:MULTISPECIES: ABC transporter permease [unclassified Paracoccus (in: a-proteobacteria)]|uniref:ABC transporter permease n=1 Tax=unclassified Paracoccus (in: a-proteobacteria) TaxID=2688777 RepID=UPI0012B3DB2C|nr:MULTISPECIES: ABC transporter permease [unclassified Paracoccus (in: a-proteobacteria)]UXU76592.1 ABC transporter permease [Paracoccus sp. SMMA_5]UXU82479.1 ABC transporter permease [Paracoccus sp. SMMA_5_TC]